MILSCRFCWDVPWSKLGPIGSRWRLEAFAPLTPPSWDEFLAEERRYWGADSANKARFHSYFGMEDPEAVFLEQTRKRYANLVQHRRRWKGLCEVGEIVQVIEIAPNVVVLSKNWKGQVSDHSDLEIWLKEERTRFLLKRVRFCCESYSFGTIVVPRGSLPNLIGEAAGSSRVSHLVGKDETVSISGKHKTVSIGNAVFTIGG